MSRRVGARPCIASSSERIIETSELLQKRVEERFAGRAQSHRGEVTNVAKAPTRFRPGWRDRSSGRAAVAAAVAVAFW